MKEYGEIQIRARELVAAELERRRQEAQLRLPHRCTHNHRQLLDVRPTVDGEPNPTYNRVLSDGTQTIGLCMLGSENGEEWSGTICEDPVDAQRCPYYTPAKSLKELMAEAQQELTDPEWLTANMPELASLLWVLEDSALPRLPWVRRLMLNFRRFKVEPLKPSVDLIKLLPDKP